MPRLMRPVLRDVATDQDEHDHALIARMAGGDQQALAVLYERHGTACYRLARRIIADAALAEDAVQEAFVAMWRSPGNYLRERGSVRAFLLALTHHKAVDLVRRETAEQRRQDAQAGRRETGSAGVDPAVAACEESAAGEVRAALLGLPENQRQALALAYFGGYTQSQIAELTGVPLGTVKTRMYLAMRRMRTSLTPDPAGEEVRGG